MIAPAGWRPHRAPSAARRRHSAYGWCIDSAERPQAFVDRPLADETRLEGNFEWRPTVATPGTFASDHPVIGVAVREQLGLALEEARGPVDVLVIDSVEAPTPN